MIKPELGQRIHCNQSHITTLNSSKPAIRIRCIDGQWIPLNPDEKSGLIVFINDHTPDISEILITEIGERVAFAKPTDYSPG